MSIPLAPIQIRHATIATLRVRWPTADDVHVHEAHRGRGGGTLLLAAAEQSMQERGRLLSGVSGGLGNPDATRLYRRLGYTATGVLDVSPTTGPTNRANDTTR